MELRRGHIPDQRVHVYTRNVTAYMLNHCANMEAKSCFLHLRILDVV